MAPIHEGSVRAHEYDPLDRLSRRIDPLGKAETFSYDGNGNLTTTTDRKNQTTTFTYDALNRRTQAAYADGSVATFTYDAGNRLTQANDTADPHRPLTFTYDSVDRLLTETTSLGTVTSTYDNAGRRTLLTLPNGVSTEYQYDAASRLIALLYRNGLTPLGDLQYTYDAAGNRVSVGGTFARALLPDPAATTTYDAGNRQLAFGDQTFTFDDAGNRLTQTDPSGTITSTWDARHRLTALTGPGLAASFAYDGLGRRAQKTVNGVPTDVVYDGLDTVTETSGGTEVAYLRTLAIDEALVRTDAVAPVFYLSDALGSTVALADGTGALTTSYSFAPFGGSAVTGTPSSNPVQFTGRENDGTGLYYYRARYYDPGRGRFIGQDPLRFLGGDVNLFAYARQNPVSRRDPFGLWYIDASFGIAVPFVPGGVGFNGGILIGPEGVFATGGVGFGIGGAVTATVMSGSPTEGISSKVSVQGGNGVIGGKVSYSVDEGGNESVKYGLGYGVGLGAQFLPVVQTKCLLWCNTISSSIGSVPNEIAISGIGGGQLLGLPTSPLPSARQK